jgi:MYXO-CTERM domain-containing protein
MPEEREELIRTAGGEVVEDMGELEGAVADGDGGGGGVVVVVLVVLLRRRRRALRGGLALPRRVALDDFGARFTCQRRQRRAASPITCRA